MPAVTEFESAPVIFSPVYHSVTCLSSCSALTFSNILTLIHWEVTNGFPTIASCLPPRDHPLRPLSPRRSSALHTSVSVQTRRKVTGRTSQSVKGLGTSLPSRSRRATTSPLNEASDDGSEFCVSSEDRLESPESSDMDMLSEHSSPATEFEDDSDIPAQKRRKLVSGPVKVEAGNQAHNKRNKR